MLKRSDNGILGSIESESFSFNNDTDLIPLLPFSGNCLFTLKK